MTIKTVSGGVRGEKGTGTAFEYEIAKEVFLSLVGTAFDREVEDYKAENAKSGGMVAQFLHAYGVSADKMEKSGLNPFPIEWPRDAEKVPLEWDEVYKIIELPAGEAKKLSEKARAEYDEGLEKQANHFIALRAERLEMTFGPAHVEEWFTAIDFETPRAKKVAVPLEIRQAKYDAQSAAMEGAGLDKEFIESAIGKRPLK